MFQRNLESCSEWIKRFRNSFTCAPRNSVLGRTFCPRNKILDPRRPFLQKWNMIVALSCLIAISLDPLFFYVPVIDNDKKCLSADRKMEIIATALRSFFDIFYIIHIIFQFRTGFIAPSSRVFERGELVEDAMEIATRYLLSYFLIDILAVLPLPQVAILIISPKMRGFESLNTKNLLKFIVFFQYVPRILRIIPLYWTTDIINETPWRGAAFKFSVYIIAGHVIGALWYMLSIEREITCWQDACQRNIRCNKADMYCDNHRGFGTISTYLDASCPIQDPNTTLFNFGIFLDALQSGVVESTDFRHKFFHCIWWGLRNLSSLGQNLATSGYVWEDCFSIFISVSGLIFFLSLIGNMLQTYMQTAAMRREEMRVKRRDTEEWMHRRLLPDCLRERIRRYQQFTWRETRGVDEDNLIRDLSKDLRRDIRHHLCLSLLRRVSMFENMDERLLSETCERLKPVLYTEETYIFREGDPCDEMLFITEGRLRAVTTNGGRTGFFKNENLKAGDFCGEKLITWALDPHSSFSLPISTWTVRTISKVEAYALEADDLKFVASQLCRRLESQQLSHIFRHYSQECRTWAACFIQATWRRYIKKKLQESLREQENRLQDALSKVGATTYASRFAATAFQDLRPNDTKKTTLPEKPAEPDFTAKQLWMPGFVRN